MEMQSRRSLITLHRVETDALMFERQPKGVLSRLARYAVRAVRAARLYARDQRDYNRLSNMPDRLLRDIGLTRDDVADARRHIRF